MSTGNNDPRVPIAIIGGSGLYELDGLKVIEERTIETPFGMPSAPILIGELDGRRVAFLPRHGKHHEYNPSTVPYRANIWALKSLGVFWVVTVSAVGSLKEEIVPGHMVIPDNIIDKTYRRANTLFDELAVHVNLTAPFDPILRDVLIDCVKAEGVPCHTEGTYVCMEGPAFSTRAESELHRSWGASLIGMTAMPEARLAREAELCYATIALSTDYDCWKDDDEVDVTNVMAIIKQNVANVRRILQRVIPAIPLEREAESEAANALQFGIMTPAEAIPEEARKKLGLFLDKYLDQ
ncbi:S-methyl-5'-thioadenosine phosphorylase [Bradymonadaceae bacterium TMQ3]|uniref:S-methyl-5'-thioadenosine phosphorylase n=1 Tax=Lujinxingia sediminis TaxID=2480984 RepID=A0ABY0CNH0_9DELT|nr:S-methyl-5'-thioadenosine phosphorylase [Lujinxingia sediminis]RDV36356.1 S-methyl-5'-thioadenosine phosphorylase [Bradymonadaceae bacterium TMQ3]RVU41454.1 S-methyl-5'-thioadenosine phosphorylase [Lujinxingia sediminis]TXC68444.1 S-methyl-5'-thioadenosine phosphorylase [Bradymonadales bacterium TMQ1]